MRRSLCPQRLYLQAEQLRPFPHGQEVECAGPCALSSFSFNVSFVQEQRHQLLGQAPLPPLCCLEVSFISSGSCYSCSRPHHSTVGDRAQRPLHIRPSSSSPPSPLCGPEAGCISSGSLYLCFLPHHSSVGGRTQRPLFSWFPKYNLVPSGASATC